MHTTFCQKRIISHASVATTLILYLVVWSSWANTAQGWLSQPSPCPEGPQAVPVWLLWHRWRGRTLLDFPESAAFPLSPGLWSFCPCPLCVTEAPHCSTQLTEHWSRECSHSLDPPFHGILINCSSSPFSQQFHPGYIPPARTPRQRIKTTHLGSFLLLPYQQAHYLCKEKKKCLTDVTHYIVDKPMPSNIILSWMFPNNLIIFPVVFQTLKLIDCLASSSSLSQHFIFLKTFVSLRPVHPPVFFRQSTALTSQQAPQRNVKNKLILKISPQVTFYWDMTYQFSDERSCRRLIHPFPRGISA